MGTQTIKYVGVKSQTVNNGFGMKRADDDFSITNYLQSALGTTDLSKDNVRISNSIQREIGIPPAGIYIPSSFLSRDLTAQTGLVPDNVDKGGLFSALAPTCNVLRAGARTVSYPHGNIKIVGFSQGPAVQWVAENSEGTPGADPVIRAISMSPKTLVCTINISRDLLLQGAFESDKVISAELVKSISREVDRVALQGLGASNEPLGIISCNDVTADSILEMSYENLVDMASTIQDNNADLNGLSLITTPKVKQWMLKNFIGAAGTTPIWNSIDDMGFYASNNMPAGSAILGDFSRITLGSWGSIDLVVNKFKYCSSGAVSITAILSIDVGIVEPLSFRKVTTLTAI